MSSKDTLAVRIDKQSDVYKEFEEYKARGGFESTSEALREIMRSKFEEQDEPTGPAAAVSKIAGEQLTEQLGVLSRYVIAVAVSLMAIEFGIPGGVLWYAPVVFFGFLAFTTVLGVSAGFAKVLDVSAGESSSSAPAGDADEVEG